MSRRVLFPGLCLSFCLAAAAQSAPAPSATPYTLRVSANEISLSFHAAGPNGAPLTHLTRADLHLTDNGKRQTNIVMLQEYDNLPIRAGFLFDTSASMMGLIDFNRTIIRMYASQLLRPGYDRAFVEQFDTQTFIRQDWTDSSAAIASGAAAVVGATPDRYDPLTAIFDSLYTTCRDQWKAGSGDVTGNFILIFTDGEDDASHAYLSEAVDMCQRTRTAIYAFLNRRRGFSDGYPTLQDLTSQTGGRLFVHPHGSQILQDLRIIEAEQRNQYRLVYKPSNFKADRSFHRIRLTCSVGGSRIVTRSGYYAFPHP